ncbi:SGNH/GDSL hydrolase family protein [Sphingobium sp. AN558]|uniref:SGNH/GDSL hydrolase family protein n=1 Tax=Sphingobium sp. AN558 TaxID=3133442 RepID=UPI0030BC29C8
MSISSVRRVLVTTALANPLSGKADVTALNALAATVATKADADDVADAFAGTAAALDLKANIAAAVQTQGLPGDSLMRFTSYSQGEADVSPPPVGTVVNNADRRVLRVTGNDRTALRERVAMEADRIYRLRYRVKRQVNSTNPTADVIRFSASWLTNAKAEISFGVFEDKVLQVSAGAYDVQFTVSRESGLGIDFTAPSNARYFVPFVYTFGAGHQTDIEIIDWEDITAEIALINAQAQPNMFTGGHTMDDADAIPYPSSGAAYAAITDAALLARGHTKGWKGAVNGLAVIGRDFVKTNFKGTTAFIRWDMQSSADDVYGVPQVYARHDGGQTTVIQGKLEEILSARAATYSARFEVPWDSFEGYLAGQDMGENQADTGASANIVGMQAHFSERPAFNINANDFPDAVANMAYPPVMFGIKGRPLPFYPRQLLKTKTDELALTATVSVNDAGGAVLPFARQGGSQIDIDPALITDGATGQIVIRRHANIGQRLRVPVTFRIGAPTGSGVRRLHFIGDSITNREQPMRATQILAAIGYTASCIGTMNNNGGGTPSAPSYGGEGREGAEFADYINEHTDFLTPLAVGSEATYRAADDNGKLGKNPYIRAAVGGDNAAFVKNGYIFDFRFYLDRFGFADPTHVIINLGRNDISQQDPAETLAQYERGYRIMRDQIRAACPTAKIGFGFYGEGLNANAVTDWNTDRWNLLLRLMELVAVDVAAGDTRLFVIPSYAHMSQEVGWATSALAIDASSRMQTLSLTDQIHPEGIGRQQSAEVTAAFVHATGVA